MQQPTERMLLVPSPKPVIIAVVLAVAFLLAAMSGVPAAQAQSFTLLHKFSGPQDGSEPLAGLVMDRAENLYGTTAMGGRAGFGTVGNSRLLSDQASPPPPPTAAFIASMPLSRFTILPFCCVFL